MCQSISFWITHPNRQLGALSKRDDLQHFFWIFFSNCDCNQSSVRESSYSSICSSLEKLKKAETIPHSAVTFYCIQFHIVGGLAATNTSGIVYQVHTLQQYVLAFLVIRLLLAEEILRGRRKSKFGQEYNSNMVFLYQMFGCLLN